MEANLISNISEFVRDQEAKERSMYGMTQEQLDAEIKRHVFPGDSGLMLACGMMSDCQEILEYLDDGNEIDREQIRKTLNRAKYIIFNYMDSHNIR